MRQHRVMSAERFVEPPQGRFAVGCASVFFGLPSAGIAFALSSEGLVALVPVLIGVALLVTTYVVFNEEVVATLDERGLRLTRARVLLGMRLAEKVDWDIPRERLTKAREVTKKTPSRQGGWNVRTHLQLPDGVTLDATTLGGIEDSQSAYNRLSRALRDELGSAFERPAPIV